MKYYRFINTPSEWRGIAASFFMLPGIVRRAAAFGQFSDAGNHQQLPFFACPGGQKPWPVDPSGSTTTDPERVCTAHPPSSATTANRARSFFMFMLYTLNNVWNGKPVLTQEMHWLVTGREAERICPPNTSNDRTRGTL